MSVEESDTFVWCGVRYTVDLYFDYEAGWHWTRVTPVDKYREWVGQAAVERKECERRESWWQAKEEGLA